MIICAGEALIDMFPSTGTDGEVVLSPKPGGAVMNTAVGLARLDVPVSFFSGLSTDMFGRQLSTHLADSGVDSAMCVRADRPTTLAFVEVIDGKVSYRFYDENTAGRMVCEVDLPDLPAELRGMLFGGISLIATPAADAYAALAARAGKNQTVMLDPNIRPGFVDDEPVYRARLERMISVSAIMKVSDEDLEWLCPKISDPVEAARSLLGQGPDLVLLTQGPEGALALHRNGLQVQVRPPETKVLHTVGAGDSFNAGFLAGLCDQGLLERDKIAALTATQIEQALSMAVRCAAITISRPGGQPPWRHELTG